LKTVLIIYPHWFPANLAGVQRPRLIGNYLKGLGWKPRVLTVKAKYFEEKPDLDFEKSFSKDFEVTRVEAFKATKPRIIGDIGLRAFYQLYKGARKIIRDEQIDCIWIPIPSFYTALLGRVLHDKTCIPYGIDYIDPWVRDLTNQNNLRAKLSQLIARTLEPYAVKKATFISGVSTPYYWPVIERNFKTPPVHVGMPYGFDPHDHEIVIEDLKTLWDEVPDCKPWIYAGAFLPNSHFFMDAFFKAVAQLRQEGNWDKAIRLYFIGTGPYPSKRITAYAKDYGLEDIVIEHRERFPFLHVLNFLSKADRVLLFGSTEKHYTASKTFQCLLSKKPLLAMLHKESSACQVLKETKADRFLYEYKEGLLKKEISQKLNKILLDFIKVNEWEIDLKPLDKYSAKRSAKILVDCMNTIVG
jgi:glycosyltransferase involved in cell wall biosynthesis